MENWQKDAQPEWPDATPGAGDPPESRPGRGRTQAFPATGAAAGTDRPTASGTPSGRPGGTAGTGWFAAARPFPHTGDPDTARPDAGTRRPEPDSSETQVLRVPGDGRDHTDFFGARPGRDRIGRGPAAPTPPARRAAAPQGTGPAPEQDTDRTDVLPAASPAPTRALPATAALRDPWADTRDTPDARTPATTGGADHTHDPYEVTVQLDAVQLGEGVLRQARSGAGRHSADASEGPVFVDASGRRSRRFRRIGIALGIACAVYAVVIVSTLLSGNSNAPWLPVPGQDGRPAGQVDTTPLPSQSAQPTASATGTPGTSPSATGGTAAAPGTSATAPGTSATPKQPGSTTGVRPSATGRTTETGGPTGSRPTATTPEAPASSADPSPSHGGGQTTTDPTTPTDPGPGTTEPAGTVVNGGDPSPLAAGPLAGPAALTSPPTEHTL